MKTRDLWLAGESYAGIYIPTLLYNIDKYNQGKAQADMINVKGMMVGNGVTNWTYDTQPATFNFSYWHALMGQEMWDELNELQCDFSGINFGRVPPRACLDLYTKFNNNTSKINMYKIFDPYMKAPTMTKKKSAETLIAGNQLLEVSDLEEEVVRGFSQRHYTPWMVSPLHKDSEAYFSALKSPASYLNNAAVRTALHIPDGHQAYEECNSGTLGFTFIMEERASQYVWEELKGKYKMMKYSGNIDAVVPTDGTLGWINSLNRTVVKEWRQFNSSLTSGQVGGWVEDLDGLTFVSVLGAGHMVPTDRPVAIKYAISSFINGTQF